jgi:hypothetical protein
MQIFATTYFIAEFKMRKILASCKSTFEIDDEQNRRGGKNYYVLWAEKQFFSGNFLKKIVVKVDSN